MLLRVDHLVGPAEIAKMLDRSRQRVFQLSLQPDFPAPTAELAMGKVWKTEDIQRWARERGYQLHGEGN